jgi:hypothetical protein
MTTNSTFFKATLVALLTLTASSAMSATYYACAGATLSFNATVAPGTTAKWDIKKDGTQFGTPSATAPTSFSAPGTYEVILVSETSSTSGLCPSDPETNTIVILPPLSLDLAVPTVPVYCAANTTIKSSDLVASGASVPAALSTDLELVYSYSIAATINGVTSTVTGESLGTIDQASGKYTLTTVVPGTYVISGTVKYKQTASNTTNTLLGTTGCPASAPSPRTVVVTPVPAKPTVTITASN